VSVPRPVTRLPFRLIGMCPLSTLHTFTNVCSW
jgi:hypothetical protein